MLKRHWFGTAVLGGLIAAAVSFSACSGKGYRIQVVRAEPHVLAGYLDYASQKKRPAFSHPVKLDQRQFEQALSLLIFRETKTLHSDKLRKIFLDPEILQLAPALAELLGEASASQAVYFAFRRRHGEGVILFSRITSGQLFMRQGKLHIIFGDIQREEFEAQDFKPRTLSFGNPYKSYRKTWKLIENKLVHFADLSGKPGKKHSTQVVIDMSRPFVEPEAVVKNTLSDAPAIVAEQPAAGKADLEQRLKKLKTLHDKGLIDKQEYQQKKQKLLQEL